MVDVNRFILYDSLPTSLHRYWYCYNISYQQLIKREGGVTSKIEEASCPSNCEREPRQKQLHVKEE